MGIKRMLRRKGRGQGLVEYALILVLVAVVSIAVLFLAGQAVQRVIGVAVGALGTNKEANEGKYIIRIEKAQCWADYRPSADFPNGATAIYVEGYTDAPAEELIGSVDRQVDVGIDENGNPMPRPVEVSGTTFKWRPYIATRPDINGCPLAAVIQGKDGSIATAPLEKKIAR